MNRAIEETERRRKAQEAYNKQHNITPATVKKNIQVGIDSEAAAHRKANAAVGKDQETEYVTQEYINELEAEMMEAAEALEFERAANLRDRITQLQDSIGEKISNVSVKPANQSRRGKRSRKGGAKIPRPKKR